MTIRGTIHGSTIELDADPGIPDGETVEIVIRVPQRLGIWGDGIRRSAGVAANVPGVTEAFDQLTRERKAARSRDSEE